MRLHIPGCWPISITHSTSHWHRESTHHGPQSDPFLATARLVPLVSIEPPSSGWRMWLYLAGGYAYMFDVCTDRRPFGRHTLGPVAWLEAKLASWLLDRIMSWCLKKIAQPEGGYIDSETLADLRRAIMPNETCADCGGPGLLQYGLVPGGMGAYVVCTSENCDKITKVVLDGPGF